MHFQSVAQGAFALAPPISTSSAVVIVGQGVFYKFHPLHDARGIHAHPGESPRSKIQPGIDPDNAAFLLLIAGSYAAGGRAESALHL